MSVDWRHLPSLSSLRAFETTASEGGFAGAARALNVTHAAVAQQVRGLEAALGVRLVMRQGRSVVLTDAGAHLAGALSEGFGQIAKGVEALADAEAHRGLRITTTQFLVDEILMPNLSQFWERHPGVEIAFFPARKFIDIIREGFDCGIRVIPSTKEPDWPGLDAIFLAKAQMMVVGAPKLVGDGTADPHDMPWLLHDEMAPKPEIMETAGLDLGRIKWVRIGSAQLQLQALRQGLGLTLFNERIARRFIEAGEIVQMPTAPIGILDYYAVVPKGPRSPLLDDFIDWVRALL
ncbi:LysR family transcriptional regulator [Alphaproteobacteria bacterium GH1-50]|uniref:LysR family transcriptional regulator n=1 Tax=Kangsaoukella pontilimi TaxID=2691042 RepID=A0A7C9IGF6_9RHOB|nr:LysR family transcriptional regulator [Kangsaoukella pontilimi]MXQ08288.1 LysR family transcriptional regulator [Kangsaoukella pontilimi]